MHINSLKKLAIIGGAKMDDKIPMLKNLSKKVDYLFITGGNINSIISNKSLLDEVKNNNAEIILPIDGFGNTNPDNKPIYFQDVYGPVQRSFYLQPHGIVNNNNDKWTHALRIIENIY